MKKIYMLIIGCLFFSFMIYGSEQLEKDSAYIKQAVWEKEMAYRHACLIDPELPEDEKSTTIAILKEKLDENPQAIFFTDIDGTRYVGRKYISDNVIDHGLPGLFCSKIKKDMILGKYNKDRITQDFIIVYFQPILQNEKDQVFSKLLDNRNLDIWYPYVQLVGDKKLEKITPNESWVVDPDRAFFLGMGEESIRAYTLSVLPTLFSNICENVITIYDPACSTGQFLESIHKVYPNARVVGQDLSASMVNFALQKIPEVYHGNSLHPCMPPQSVDLIVFRFLNGDVVTTAKAYDLFDALIKTVKKSGYVILFGHTPVLIDLEWLQFYGLTVIQANGLSREDQSVFQYYILQN